MRYKSAIFYISSRKFKKHVHLDAFYKICFLRTNCLKNRTYYFLMCLKVLFIILKIRDSCSRVRWTVRHSLQRNWLKYTNKFHWSNSWISLFRIKITWAWRHVDDIFGRPVADTKWLFAHKCKIDVPKSTEHFVLMALFVWQILRKNGRTLPAYQKPVILKNAQEMYEGFEWSVTLQNT